MDQNLNLDLIIQFLKSLENENICQKNKINELETHSKTLSDDLGNLSKVSMISNLDKQLKEKIYQITTLEQQLDKSNRQISELQKKIPKNTKTTKLENELKDKTARIFSLENEIEKINTAFEENLSLLKIDNIRLQDENGLLQKEINELKIYIARMEEEDEPDNDTDDDIKEINNYIKEQESNNKSTE